MEREQVYIFDTTLRDGQQCPGAGMEYKRNIEYAKLAAKLGVDVLEAGFPSASKMDFKIVQAIARELSPDENSPVIAGLCQLRSEQIDVTIEALEPAVSFGKARLHTYLPVDPQLMPASLGLLASDKQKLVEQVAEFVARAVKAGLQVQFSPEGYSRVAENFDFTTDLIRAAVASGATVINCPDTIGGACKTQGEEYFVRLMNTHAEIIRSEFPDKEITWSVHCHNDFGLAVANSMNAVFEGPARQIEGCINGIGERAGNASLEQCIMLIKHFGELSDGRKFFTRAKTPYIQEASNFVANYMLPRQPHWPICGENAARHSSGGHTNAILKFLHAYQPFNPEETGNKVSLLFGPMSGGNHAKSIIESAGFVCTDEEKSEISQFIKTKYAERRKGITDAELLKAYFEYRRPIHVTSFDYSRSSNQSAVHLEGKFYSDEGSITEKHEGRDSALAALKTAINKHHPGLEIVSHQSHSEGESISAQSVSKIVLSDEEGAEYIGIGKDRDIEISAMKALIDAANSAYIEAHYRRV